MASEVAAVAEKMMPFLPPGTVIGRKYRVDGLIAEGGMGLIYRGWHLVLEQPIAIKVLRPEYANRPELASRFVNEARATARLHGIHSIHVLDLGRLENGPPVMVLEYLEGFDLRELLSTFGPLSLARAVDYVLQTCDAISEAHSQGIVHRDVKPENLFIHKMPDGTQVLKVIDFGISKRLDAGERCLTQQNQSFGSPDYMPPEQMTTPEQVDARADVWSIGVVLFELLTGTAPFRGSTMQATCAKVMSEEPRGLRSLRPELPEQLEHIVERCLRKDRQERYATVKELAAELALFASSESGVALGSSNASGAVERSSPTSSAIRVLSCYSPEASAPRRAGKSQTSEPEDRVPITPLWPWALPAAVAAVLLVFAVYDPRSMRDLALNASTRAETAAQSAMGSIAKSATDTASMIESKFRRFLRDEVAPNSSAVPEPSPASTAENSGPMSADR